MVGGGRGARTRPAAVFAATTRRLDSPFTSSNMLRPRVVALALLAVATGCVRAYSAGSTETLPVRPATELPARFDPPDAAITDGTCQNPVRDPRTGAERRFVRSAPGIRDYAVPTGSCGARPGELLRIDRRTWQAVGRVPR